MAHNPFDTLQELRLASGAAGRYHSLPALEKAGVGKVSRLPVSIRIVLESVLRNCDGIKLTEQHVRQVATWAPTGPRVAEIPFVVARVVLQDFTGVPLLCDLAAMRNVAADMKRDPKLIEPLVPVDLVVDHSVMVDYYGSPEALDLNMKLEFRRNAERMSIYDAAMQYQRQGVPTIVFGGEEYGTGSSRDWAAKGTQLLGVKAVVARSFERIHRSNLVGMGVLPLQFAAGESAETLGIKGDETFDIAVPSDIRPQQDLALVMTRPDGTRREITVRCRIDTPIEVDYYRHGGILPYVLRELMQQAA